MAVRERPARWPFSGRLARLAVACCAVLCRTDAIAVHCKLQTNFHPTDGNRNDVWYSEDGKNWDQLPGTPWSLRHACGVHVHRDALFLAAGSAITISAEQAELSKHDFAHRVESAWRPGDVWRLDRTATAG